VAEVHDGDVVATLAHSGRHQPQVVVLHEDHGVGGGLVGDHVGEGLVHLAVGRPGRPPALVEARSSRQVEQAVVDEPERGVADDVVVLAVDAGVDGEGADVEAVGGDASLLGGDSIASGHGGGDPGGVGVDDERRDAGHQPTRAALGSQLAVVVDVERERPAVRHDHQRSLGHAVTLATPRNCATQSRVA
jgi:hypothetical protein